MKFLADNGGLQALIQAIKDQLALFDRNKQDNLVAGRGITINQSTRVISSDGEPNVQADWNMSTESSASFIRNKPDIYTKREIDSMFSATITFVRVDELPATGTHGTVYLVPKQGAGTDDIYDEYLWLSASGSVEAHYELIGSTSVDLTNYYTKTQTDNLLDDKVDKVNGKGLSTEDYTTAEKNKLSSIENGAEVNVQSDWNESDSTKDDFIKNKPTLRQPSADGTAGQYLKSNGSGNAPSWETMDSSPTENSAKAVTSGGVKTALDGKQASISITTKTDDAGDNDKVILQDNGVTNTTTFVRRSLTNIWNWCRTKLFPEVNIEWGTSDVIRDVSALDFVSNYRQRGNALPSSAIVYERSTDGGTTWVDDSSHVGFVNQTDRLRITIIGRESDGTKNVIYCQVAKHFINMRAGTCHYALYGINKEGEVTQITSGRVSGNTHPNSIYAKNKMLGYYKTQYQADAYIKHRFEFWQEEGDNTYTGTKYPLYVGLTPKVIWGGNNTLQYGVPYVITTDNTTYKENVKFPQNVEAAKFVKTNGTANQVLLANGDVMGLPVPVNKGGTGQTTAQSACNAFINSLSTGTATPTDSDYYVCQYAGGGTSTTTYHRRPMSSLWNWIKTHFDTAPTANSDNPVTSGGIKTALDGYFPLAGKKAIAGVYKNAPSYIHNVDFGNTSTEGIWRKFCVISTRQTYRNAVGEIHVNARGTQGTIYLTIGSSGTFPPEGENNTLSPSVKYLSLYNDYRPVYWRVNDDNELELWWKATQYYDSFGVTGVNFSPYFLSLDSVYNAGVNVRWTNVVSLEAPANLSQARDVSLTTLDVSAGDVLTIDGDNYKDYLRTPSDGIPTNVLEADRIVLPRAYSTIFFNTTNTATISYIRGASNSNVQKNGRRLTIAGNWKPREESSGDGRFTQYLYKYRGGSVGTPQFTDCLREAYEDFVYFNGIWYSKGY